MEVSFALLCFASSYGKPSPIKLYCVVVRMQSPIDWYYYTAHNLAVNPGDECTSSLNGRFIVIGYPI
jgi:hypothetical protein